MPGCDEAINDVKILWRESVRARRAEPAPGKIKPNVSSGSRTDAAGLEASKAWVDEMCMAVTSANSDGSALVGVEAVRNTHVIKEAVESRVPTVRIVISIALAWEKLSEDGVILLGERLVLVSADEIE